MLVVLALIGLFFLPTPWSVLALIAAAVVEVLEVAFWIRFLRRYRIRTGVEAMVGRSAEVVESCDPLGRVRFDGELWNARAEATLIRGQIARISGLDGLTLVVEPPADTERAPLKGPLVP